MLSPIAFEQQQKLKLQGVQETRGYSNPGSLTPRVQLRATKPCAHHAASVEPSGDDGEGPARHRSEGGPERYHRRSRVEI